MPKVPIAPLVALVLLAGCYESHPGTAAPGRDAGPGMDGRVPPLPDAGPFDAPPGVDVGPPGEFDAGPPRDAGPRRDSGPRRDAGPPPDSGPDGGPARPALRFGPTTFMAGGDSPSFDRRFDGAYELWVRPRTTDDGDFCRKGDGTARHLVAGQRGGNLIMGWQVALESYYLTGPPLVPGRWTYVAQSWSRNGDGTHSVTMYVDGLPVATGVFPRLQDSFNDIDFICGRFDVDVDEIRIWRISRSDAEIASTWMSSLSSGIPGMVSYYRLNESGQIAIDYAFGSNPAVLGRLTTPDPADPTWIQDGPF